MVIKIQKPPILLQIFTDYYTVSETSVFGAARRRHVERSVTRRLGFGDVVVRRDRSKQFTKVCTVLLQRDTRTCIVVNAGVKPIKILLFGLMRLKRLLFLKGDLNKSFFRVCGICKPYECSFFLGFQCQARAYACQSWQGDARWYYVAPGMAQSSSVCCSLHCYASKGIRCRACSNSRE